MHQELRHPGLSRHGRNALDQHAAAVASYARAARDVAADPARWSLAPAAGKWTPAQVTLHLVMSFDAARRELDGGAAMALRTTWWQRAILRVTVVPVLLRGGPFPRGARAPREVRPPVTTEGGASLIQRFEGAAAQLEGRVAELMVTRPGLRMTHPYFGPLSMDRMLRMSARHIEHHRGQLST
jgi:hypothetical protein